MVDETLEMRTKLISAVARWKNGPTLSQQDFLNTEQLACSFLKVTTLLYSSP